MSGFAANGLARTAADIEESTGSGVEQALVAAGDVFSGLANFTPFGIAKNVAEGFAASQQGDEERSFIDNLVNGGIVAGARGYESFYQFGKPILDTYTWDNNFRTYEYLTDLPAYYATNAAVLWQSAADASRGEFDANEFATNADIASNIFSDTYNEGGIDVGQAILTNFAAAGQVATAPLQGIVAALTGKPLDSIQAEQGRIAREWSLGFMDPNFNLFSAEDRKVFDEGLSRTLSGTLSAASQVALDPLNVLPFGALGKVVKGRRLLNTASKISEDERLLVRAAEGDYTKYSRDLDFFARNNAGTIQQHALLRSVAGPQRSQLAYLLGEVTTKKDAAKVFLAVERGSLRAQVELANKYSHLGLSLDGLNAGGYVNRQALKSEVSLGVIDQAEYLDAVAAHLDTVDADPFVKTMTDLAYRQAEGQVVGGPQALRTMRSAGFGADALERASAVARARLIQDGRDGFHFFTRAGEGNPLVQHIIRPVLARTARGVMVNGRGFLDVDDATGLAFDRFAGNLSDIDLYTKNELTRSGLKQSLMDRFRLATSAEEKRQVVEEANAIAFRLLAERRNLSKEAAADTWDKFRTAHIKYFNARRERGFAVLPDGSVVRDPILKEATPGTVELMDWKLINQALRENAVGLKASALRAYGKTGRGTYTFLSAVNNLHIFSILFRPARVPRERMQGSLGVIGSGYWRDMWFDPDITRSPQRILSNMRDRGSRSIDRLQVRFGKLDDPKALSELTGETTAALQETERTIAAVRQRVTSLLRDKNLDADDRVVLEGLLDELDGDLFFHGSPDGLPGTLEDRWLATDEIANNAQRYIDNAFPRISVSRQLGREVNPDELRSASATNRWQKTIADTRTRNSARANEIAAKQQELQPLGQQLTDQQAVVQEAETRWADAESLLAQADAALNDARATGASGRKALIAQRAQAQRALNAAKKDAGAARRNLAATETRIRKAEEYIASRETAQQADEAAALERINRGLGQTFDSLDSASGYVAASSGTVDSFRTSLLDEIASGNTVQRMLNGRWVTETSDRLSRRSPVILAKQEFRVIPAGKTPQLARVRAFGARADMGSFDGLPAGLASHMGWNTQADVAAFFADPAWRNDAGFMAWIKANRFGKVAVPDASAPSGTTVYLLPEMTDYSGNSAMLRRTQEQEAMPEAAMPEGGTAITNATTEARVTAEAARETRRTIKATDVEGLRQQMRSLVDQRARLRNEQATYAERTAAAKARVEGKQKPLKRRGQGQVEINGTLVDDAFGGTEGDVWAARASSKSTFDNLVQSANAAHSAIDDIVETTILSPSDPQYFDGWAEILNTHYRLADGVTPDPIVKMIAEGADDDVIRNWLLHTREGKSYRDAVGVGKKYEALDPKVAGWRPDEPLNAAKSVGLENMSVEDYVATLRMSVNDHLPTDDLRARFLGGEEFVSSNLQTQFGAYADLLPRIDGRISIPAERRGATDAIRRAARSAQRVINEMPQDAMENHPMFVAAYRNILQERWDDTVASLGRDLTSAEAADLVGQARRVALKEVRKWTYTIANTTNATETLRLVMPFITAYTYTFRTLGRALRDNPAETLWAAWNANRAIGQLPWVDAEGNPTNFLNAEAAVIDVSPEMAKVLGKIPLFGTALASATEFRISKRSMDVFFGGEFAPGAGVLVTVPMGEWVRRNPEWASNRIVDWALPLGAGRDAMDIAAPQALSHQVNKWRQEDSAEYAAKLVQVAAQEDAKWRMGLRDEPKPDEIRALTNALFDLSSGISFFSPISFSATQPAQEARRTYDQYVAYYGKEEADWRFLAEQPELAQMFASATQNNYRIDPTQEAVANLRKYSDLADAAATSGEAGKEMLGFLMNGSGSEEFDSAANTWLRQNAPGTTGETYIEALSPEESLQRAAARNGWIEWRQITNLLDAAAVKRGTTVEADSELAALKKYAGFMLGQSNPEWARARKESAANKFNDQADVLEAAFADEAWVRDNGNKPEVKALMEFIEVRSWIQDAIATRGREQNLTTLAANPDLKAAYLFAVQQLKQESVAFAEFYNQYFDEDTVV